MNFQVLLTIVLGLVMCVEGVYIEGEGGYIEGSYIIMLKDGSTESHINYVIKKIEDYTSATRDEMKIESDVSIVPMIFGKFNEETAKMVSELAQVDLVEKDQIMSIAMPTEGTQDSPIIESGYSVPLRPNLDILDNKNCTDGMYNPENDGTGVDIYILDTGINYDHIDFGYLDGRNETRAKYGGYDAIDKEFNETRKGRDCQGHGTHCAGIAAGLYSGVAKNANLLSIRVLSCTGSGSSTTIIKGMRAVRRRHKDNMDKPDFKGSVISMSLGGGKSESIDKVLNNVIKTEGIAIVTASGNENSWACGRSPGGAGSNINVGAHSYDPTSCKKPMASFSNFGTCVDIMAPGVSVLSANNSDVNGFARFSGTSMACPHVAGVVALMKAENETLTSQQIKDNLKAEALDDIDRSQMPLYVRCSSDSRRLYLTPKLWEN